METKAAGSVFWAFLLVLFPVAVQLSSPGCVTYKHRQTCGLKGSSVEFPCSYPKHVQVVSKSGWSKSLHPNMKSKLLKHMPAYTFRMNYLELGNSDCTMRLSDLKKSDESVYYFIYNFRNVTGHLVTCSGVPGVSLHILESPVFILMEKLVRGQYEPVADWTVIGGQKIMLTCVLTCAANLSFNPGFIWYKNRQKLNGSKANLHFLSLDPIIIEDMGSYVCAMIGYEDLPSSALNLRVQTMHRNTVVSDEIPEGGSQTHTVPTLTHSYEAQNSTDQIFDSCQRPKGLFIFFAILVASVCAGLVITVVVVILFLKVKKKKKKKRRRRCACSVAGPPSANSGAYIALDINSMSAEYNTLDTVRRCSGADTVYENVHEPSKSIQ